MISFKLRLLVLVLGMFATSKPEYRNDDFQSESTSSCVVLDDEGNVDFSSLSYDWGPEDIMYEYYAIPVEYSNNGGCLPWKVQIFTQAVCKKYNVDYALVLSIIELESSFFIHSQGDSGNSKGYMQIYEKYHVDRMAKLGCNNLLNPYQNIIVGVDYLSELLSENPDVRYALMCYNRGRYNDSQTGGVELWEQGIYSTEYSEKVLSIYERIVNELLYRY